MRRLKVSALLPGMRLGHPVYGSRGLLLKEGIELTPLLIERLRQARVEAVYIDDPLFADLEPPPDVSWEVKSSLLEAYAALWNQARSLGSAAALGEPMSWAVPYHRFLEAAGALEDELRQVPASSLQLVVSEGEEDGPAAHALNVALLAAALARQAGLGGYVRELALGGLWHDLGLALLPPALRSEPEEAGPEEQRLLHTHPFLGVKLLRDQPVSAYVQAAVAQHHEKFDGSGYPQRLSGSRLSAHAQVVAMADAFVRLAERGWGRSEAWEYVVSGAGGDFDHRLAQAFSRTVPPFPVGATVRLSTGEEGVVTGLETGLLTRPQVRLLRDAEGRALREQVTFDLSQAAHRHRVIAGEVE